MFNFTNSIIPPWVFVVHLFFNPKSHSLLLSVLIFASSLELMVSSSFLLSFFITGGFFFNVVDIFFNIVEGLIFANDLENSIDAPCNRLGLLSQHRLQLLQSLLHEFQFLFEGNWDTLEVRPKERGLDARQELLQFYNENYSANRMHLVIYAKDDLDKSESLVKNKFEKIRNTDLGCVNFTGQPCDSENLQIIVKAVPIKQGHKLRFVWPKTPGIHHYKEGPSRYLGHLIGHEGEGSLFYVLKKLGGC